MAKDCGCGSGRTTAANGSTYEVTTGDGSKIRVRSEGAARTAAKKSGGTYQKVS